MRNLCGRLPVNHVASDRYDNIDVQTLRARHCDLGKTMGDGDFLIQRSTFGHILLEMATEFPIGSRQGPEERRK